jgi:hypothetical protein
MIGTVPAARVVHSSLQDTAFAKNENGITLVSSSVRLTIMGRVQTIPDLHINVTAAIARRFRAESWAAMRHRQCIDAPVMSSILVAGVSRNILSLTKSRRHRQRRCTHRRTTVQTWRRIMKALVAALALATLIAIPTFTQSASAAPMSPASSSFGSNGY